MRGKTLQIGELYKAKYYGFKEVIENGKKVYSYDEEPIYFTYKQTTVAGSAVFTASKGYETSATTINQTLNTYNQKFRIQTNDSHIPFKIRGKVEIEMDGLPKKFIITKLTTLAGGVYSLNSTRNGSLNSRDLPLLIELD